MPSPKEKTPEHQQTRLPSPNAPNIVRTKSHGCTDEPKRKPTAMRMLDFSAM